LQDDLVDIVDFSILASGFNTAVPVDHNVGADATGDGQQATADFVAIQQSFLQVSDAADACPIAVSGGSFGDGGVTQRRPMHRIPIRNLSFSTARAADLNDDGVVDLKDIREFAWEYNLPLLPEFSDKLDRIDEIEHSKRARATRR